MQLTHLTNGVTCATLDTYDRYDTSSKEVIVARVQIINEVPKPERKPKDWVLHLQWCRYLYDDGNMERGYRFIWRRPKTGALQPARGQARIVSLRDAERLIQRARNQGWGDNVGD